MSSPSTSSAPAVASVAPSPPRTSADILAEAEALMGAPAVAPAQARLSKLQPPSRRDFDHTFTPSPESQISGGVRANSRSALVSAVSSPPPPMHHRPISGSSQGPKTAERTRTLDDLLCQIDAAELAAELQVNSDEEQEEEGEELEPELEEQDEGSSVPSTPTLDRSPDVDRRALPAHMLVRPQAAEHKPDAPERSASPTDILTYEEFVELAVEVQGVLDDEALLQQFREIGGGSGGITLQALAAHSAERDSGLAKVGTGKRPGAMSSTEETDETEETMDMIRPDDWAEWEAEQEQSYGRGAPGVSAAAAEFEASFGQEDEQKPMAEVNQLEDALGGRRFRRRGEGDGGRVGVAAAVQAPQPRSLQPLEHDQRATTPDSIRRVRNWVDWGHPATPTLKSRRPEVMPLPNDDHPAAPTGAPATARPNPKLIELGASHDRPGTPSKSILNWPPPVDLESDVQRRKPYPTIELPSLGGTVSLQPPSMDGHALAAAGGGGGGGSSSNARSSGIMRPMRGLRPGTGRSGISMVSFDDEPPVQWDFATSGNFEIMHDHSAYEDGPVLLGRSPDSHDSSPANRPHLPSGTNQEGSPDSGPSSPTRAQASDELRKQAKSSGQRGAASRDQSKRLHEQQQEQRRREPTGRRDATRQQHQHHQHRAGAVSPWDQSPAGGGAQSSSRSSGFDLPAYVTPGTEVFTPDTVSASTFLDNLSGTASPAVPPPVMPQYIAGALSTNERRRYHVGTGAGEETRGAMGMPRSRRGNRSKSRGRRGSTGVAGDAYLLGKNPLAAPLSRAGGRSPSRRRPSPMRESEYRAVRESRSAGGVPPTGGAAAVKEQRRGRGASTSAVGLEAR